MSISRKFLWKVNASIALGIAVLCSLVSVGFYQDVDKVGNGNSYMMMKENPIDYYMLDDFSKTHKAQIDGTRKAILTTLGFPVGASALLILIVALLTQGIPKRIRLCLKISFWAVTFVAIVLLAAGYGIANPQYHVPETFGLSASIYAIILCVLGLFYKVANRFLSRIVIEDELSEVQAQVEGIDWNRGAFRIWLLFTFIWVGYFAFTGIGGVLSGDDNFIDELETAYTFGPSVPILLLVLWFVGCRVVSWIAAGFKHKSF